MAKNIDDLLRVLTFEVLSAERRNLRSKALTDQKMSEETNEARLATPHSLDR